MIQKKELYLIPFLHQTTTLTNCQANSISCILFLFYIKPQRPCVKGCDNSCCILFLFYIKPQPPENSSASSRSCILFLFYIKPQLVGAKIFHLCVVSYSFSTSNHNLNGAQLVMHPVVSYSFSTSNHNIYNISTFFYFVVSYSFSTSNHNLGNLRPYITSIYTNILLTKKRIGFPKKWV